MLVCSLLGTINSLTEWNPQDWMYVTLLRVVSPRWAWTFSNISTLYVPSFLAAGLAWWLLPWCLQCLTSGQTGWRAVGHGIGKALCAVSTLLCLVWIIIWWRSQAHADFLEYTGEKHAFSLEWGAGLTHTMLAADTATNVGWNFSHSPYVNSVWEGMTPRPGRWGFGFHLTRTAGRWRLGGQRICLVYIPIWALVGTTALLPLFQVCRFLLKHCHEAQGECQHCSYDLTGNTSGVCPECGAAVRSDPLIASDRESDGCDSSAQR